MLMTTSQSKQVGDVRCGLEAKRRELAHLLRTADIGDDPMSGGGKVCGHRRTHVTEADKADARAGLVLKHWLPPYYLLVQRPLHRSVIGSAAFR